MWGMIATWRMAVEGITKGAEMLKDGGDAGDAVESAIREVEDFPYYKSVGIDVFCSVGPHPHSNMKDALCKLHTFL